MTKLKITAIPCESCGKVKPLYNVDFIGFPIWCKQCINDFNAEHAENIKYE